MSRFDLYKIGVGHTLYLALAGAGIGFLLQSPGPVHLAICLLPALLGLVLTFTSTSDEIQYAVRLMAAAAFAPVLLLFWTLDDGLSMLPQLGAGLLHLLLFAGSVLWIGPKLTRVPANAGAPPVDAATLQARLLSLEKMRGPLQVSSPAANEVTVAYRYRSPKSYRVLLHLDPATHRVSVRERASANLADATTDSERSLRGLGDPAFDPSRPEARAISETVAQVTPIRAAELAATPVTWVGQNAATAPPDFAASLDERGMATLLCAVVTRSGWCWQPAFFGGA